MSTRDELRAAAINRREQPETTAAPQPSVVDDLAQRLTAMGNVLNAAVAVVAAYEGGNPDGYVYLRAPAFRALRNAVERAQPGAVEATRKALGR